MKKNVLIVIAVLTVVISVAASLVVTRIFQRNTTTVIRETQPTMFTNYYPVSPDLSQPVDFTYAARITTRGVVHVTSKVLPKKNDNSFYNPFRDFFGDNFWGWGAPPKNYEPQPDISSGSGVIISPDGYIVTNNHVIKNADEIEVILYDNEKYTATLIGNDPSTDLALLKIEKTDLPYIVFGNSDSLEVGAWVLAVGNPFNLSSTVTAGIVSAKGRNINILDGQSAIESFIQTDAAVNPGNSGGALVDIKGRLIGINTAIASPTGAYAGYSFAVPSNLVKKVVRDIKEYGIVQRGFLGVTIRNIDSDLAKENNLKEMSGVFVEEVMEGSAADEAGIKPKDVIKSINGIAVNSSPQLQEVVAQYRPGDKLHVAYVRDGSAKETTITLKNKNKSTELLTKSKIEVINQLGIELTPLSQKEKEKLGINSGVKVSGINEGKIKRHTDMREGFIITKIDKQPVNSADDVVRILEGRKGGVMIEGIYPDYAGTYYYAFGM
ncbi:MAG TPA: Do family serine endopeptidase [Chitinophagales bacterium]|nr:Do family serine endopeptidase [Chitinophagales bacterium]